MKGTSTSYAENRFDENERFYECLRLLQYLLQVANTSETPPEL